MKRDCHVRRPFRGIRQWLGTWKWTVVISTLAVLVIAVVAWGGHQLSPTFFADFAANFVADACVAGIAFLLATVAFGYWEHREQERQARHKAFGILRKELTYNLSELEWLIVWARRGASEFREEYNAWAPQHRGLKTGSWQLLIQSGLASALPHDVWLSVQDSYATSTEAMTTLYRRASDALRTGDWPELVDRCLPEFEEARDLTADALGKLKSGLPQRDWRSDAEGA